MILPLRRCDPVAQAQVQGCGTGPFTIAMYTLTGRGDEDFPTDQAARLPIACAIFMAAEHYSRRTSTTPWEPVLLIKNDCNLAATRKNGLNVQSMWCLLLVRLLYTLYWRFRRCGPSATEGAGINKPAPSHGLVTAITSQ